MNVRFGLWYGVHREFPTIPPEILGYVVAVLHQRVSYYVCGVWPMTVPKLKRVFTLGGGTYVTISVTHTYDHIQHFRPRGKRHN